MALWQVLTGRRDDVATVPRQWRAALGRVLAPFEGAAPGLPGDLRDYVLTGSPAGVLQNPALRTNAGRTTLGAGSVGFDGDQEAMRALCTGLGSVPSEVVVRWARVLEVSAGSWSVRLDPVAGAHWAENLVVHLAEQLWDRQARRPTVPVDIAVVEDALVSVGAPRHDLMEAAFRDSGKPEPSWSGTRKSIRALNGYAAAVARDADVLRRTVAAQGARGQLVALEMLAPLPDDTLRLFVPEIAAMLASGSKQVRAAVAPVAARCGTLLTEPLRELTVSGTPETRLHALRALAAAGDDARAWALEHASSDRAASVRALVAELAADPAGATDGEPAPPQRPTIDWRVRVTPELTAQLEDLWTETNRKIELDNLRAEELEARTRAQHPGYEASRYRTPPLDRGTLRRFLSELGHGTPPATPSEDAPHVVAHLLERRADRLALGPAGVVALLHHLGHLVEHGGALSRTAATLLEAEHARTGRPTVLEVATMLDELGLDGGRAVYRRFASPWGPRLGRDWPDEQVSPFVLAHLDLVLRTLSSTDRDWSIAPEAPYRALATLPTLPRRAVDALFATALSGNRVDRRPAQSTLDHLAGTEARIVAALQDGKFDVRAEAAGWLRRRRAEAAVPALEAAVGKEKHDLAKGAMLDALEAMGFPVERYVDRGELGRKARAAVAKGLPKELGWFPWAGLPEVRWADSGEPVGTETLQWLLAQAVRAKSPEPNAMLRKYCAMFAPADGERLGQFVLEAWLAEDTRPIDADEAYRRAAQEAGWTHQSMARYPQGYQNNPLLGASVEEITAAYLPRFLREPVGSAAASKGLLAVVAACAGERAAPPVARYLRDWYGKRAAQSKALVAMLGWIEHPTATQLMLSVGSRFRTRSIQEEANRQALALAERKGWTVDELADRTVPTAGLDESGRLDLSYGERTFAAVLRPELTLELRSPEEKKITSLPAPRRTDDPDRAAESRKALAAARKELKAVVQLQTQRLYEALCTGRTWSFEDWDRYLARHPVVRHLVRRLVWTATAPDGSVVVFRPLDDGSLTDVDDEAVAIAPDAVVRLAHDTNLDAESARRWIDHLADYEVAPLFTQLGRDTYVLPDGGSASAEITDFRGHVLEAFALRGRAGKLGYTRGQTEDGGWFFTYEKRFPTLGLSTVVEFSGNGLPEENNRVALTALRFVRHTDGGGGHGAGGGAWGREASGLLLGDVPAVLLSEAYGDMGLMAADGTGFDPDWEKVVGR
ncbi:DUF4132 domain-containing protein [Georgenia sp. SUBG003]|uniref:DUF4132 domain-containing protein n=1 Tax=Georgenia sp. SUBG003 TaxID=1497974 RepID=UPI0004D9D9B8|nr:hypothetical protein DA06_22175 [Georgenia sp. SUBG003]